MEFVGRKNEIEQLQKCYESSSNEFIAVYGRRRVGKTSLIDHCFGDSYFFRHVGMPPKKIRKDGKRPPSPLKEQLNSFSLSLSLAGWKPAKKPSTWLEAFYELILFIKSDESKKRKVLFIDEIPWMDTPKSSFLESFSWFINSVLSMDSYNVMIIIAGSSTSWMLDNVVNDYGGLYGRTTLKICIAPFSLCETELALKGNGVNLSRYQIALVYMALGGVPYYLKQIKPNLSVAQSIDAMFFKPDSEFKEEFTTLFSSMFDKDRLCEKIVRVLVSHRKGLRREELLSLLKVNDGKDLSNALQALEKGSFLIKYIPYKGRSNHPLYKLIDPFCIFYLSYVESRASLDTEIWSDTLSSQKGSAWSGYAFENLAFSHLKQIKYALSIHAISSMQFSWSSDKAEERPTQIDLVIERKDKIINLCEMKFYSTTFTVNEAYHEKLMNRARILRAIAPKDTAIRHVAITTFGVNGPYKDDFANVIVLDDLFLP